LEPGYSRFNYNHMEQFLRQLSISIAVRRSSSADN
jgi:hypothetical protein